MRKIIKIFLVIIALTATLFLAGFCVYSNTSTQKTAENSVKFMQGYVLRYIGENYKSIDFDEIVPVYLCDEDSTIAGYYIDHRFTTVKGNPTLDEISHKRYYLNDDCTRVLDMKAIWIPGEKPEGDDEGLALIREDYLSKETQK